jgi:hypothetical protein
MRTSMKKLIVMLALTGMSGTLLAESTDSTSVNLAAVKPVVETYLLAHGQLATQTGNYDINQVATPLRCNPATTPSLITNVSSIAVYGSAQAIEGIHNTLAFIPESYSIKGMVSAPVNVAARDNGVTVNWQVWCQANQTA